MKQWCLVRFNSGGTEVVPHTWLQGEKVFWPPYPPKESGKVRAAIRRREEPNENWQTYEPVRVLISRDTFEEAERCLERYVKQQCDTTDIQSEEECQQPLKRRKKPNPIYQNLDDSEEDQPRSKYPRAPKILFPASGPLQSPSPSSQLQLQPLAPVDYQTLTTLQSPSPSSQLQPLAPVDYQTTFSNPTSYQTLPTPASCQSPLPYPNSQPITFSAEDFQFPLQSFVPVASAGTPRCAPHFSPEDSRDSARQLLKGKCKTVVPWDYHRIPFIYERNSPVH
ncbi:uncharacterized protein LOC143127231 [Alosa pseudoharengus]|uniref:uncharacterized protein LOC143102338 n=1 Tax=Alosa pseudoharengus TaxID=34774 RepID=UPI003F8C04C7